MSFKQAQVPCSVVREKYTKALHVLEKHWPELISLAEKRDEDQKRELEEKEKAFKAVQKEYNDAQKEYAIKLKEYTNRPFFSCIDEPKYPYALSNKLMSAMHDMHFYIGRYSHVYTLKDFKEEIENTLKTVSIAAMIEMTPGEIQKMEDAENGVSVRRWLIYWNNTPLSTEKPL